MLNKKGKLCLSYFFYLVILLFLYHSKINFLDEVPFFYSFIFMLMYFKVNIFFVAITYLIIINIFSFTLKVLIISVIFAIYIILISYLHKLIKLNIVWIIAYYLISQIFIWYTLSNISLLYEIILLVLGTMVLIAYINYFKAYYKDSLCGTHFTVDQNICGAIFLVSVFLGVAQIGEQSLIKFFGVLSILYFTYIYERPTSVIIAILIGIGDYLHTSSSINLFYFAFISIFCYGFKEYKKILSCLSVLLAQVIFNLYICPLGYYEIKNIIPELLACVIFLLTNKFVVNFLKEVFGVTKNTYGIKTLVNRNKEQICYKMNELSQIFAEMNVLYASMVVQSGIKRKEATDILTDRLIKNVCKNCQYKDDCLNSIYQDDNMDNDDILHNLKILVNIGLKKNKVNILDVPNELNRRCHKINQILSNTNSLISSYKEYTKVVKNSDISKLLIAEQLKGVSSLLDMLSLEIGTALVFNSKLEQKIREELEYYDILCEEVLCYETTSNNDGITISIVLPNQNIKKSVLEDKDKLSGLTINIMEKVITKILKQPYSVSLEKYGNFGNVYEFKQSAKYGFVFGASGKGKENISGDTFSFTRINKNKVMFAINDGMGTGENAQNISKISLNLIENFYKAGYDTQIILSSVNKLLSRIGGDNQDESYSALDILVFDLNSGLVDFIKQGAPDGIVKSNSMGIERIKSESLPLGILLNEDDDIQPMILEREINPNDIYCIFSDGIVDSFNGIENLIEYIDKETSSKKINPQTLADNILEKSLNYNNSLDDKTVICVRIYKNY